MNKSRGKTNSLEDSEYLGKLLSALAGKMETPALIAYLADERARLLLCKALVSPVSGSDRQLAERARKILQSRGLDADQLKKRLEPAAFALGLVSACDFQIDYYDVLGVEHSATPSEIRSAYRKKAFEIHPDTAGDNGENSADFVTLKAAYDTLLDSKSRAVFDRCREDVGYWHEAEVEERPGGEKVKRRTSGKFLRTRYRIAAVVMVMIVIAWVLSVFYERETMLELAQVASSSAPEPARETAGSPDTGEVESKAPVVSQGVEDKVAPKPATKTPEPVRLEPEPARKVEEGVAVSAAAEVVPDGVEKEETYSAKLEQVIPPPPVKNESAKTVPVPEQPVEMKESPSVETEKKQTTVVRESLKKTPKELPKPAKKETVKEIPEVVKMKQPSFTVWVPLKLPEKPAEQPVQQTATKLLASGTKPGLTPSPAEKVQTTKSIIPAKVAAQAPVFPLDSTDGVTPPKSSLHASKVPSPATFPEIPLPKTHKTPFVKRSQVLAFLKKYTTAYERGNAEIFFSYFTSNATENGKPLKSVRPDYLEIWDKVKSLDYRISLDETEQEVGSDTVSMKGRFDLGWVFLDGPSGQSRGEIAMDLKVNKKDFRISRLDYRFEK